MKNTLGILGFGVVGKSALKFLREKNKKLQINIWDKRSLSREECDFINKYKAICCDALSLDQFLDTNEKIFLSPGFSLDKIKNKEKSNLLCEVDLFQSSFAKDVVAITGSLGKTTITSFLSKISRLIRINSGSFVKTIEAGNIGTAMLNVIDNNLDIVFLELSSFQLKFNKIFSPKISIFNNFYPNHLNWHGTLDDYFESKCNIFEYQTETQYSVFPIDFLLGNLPKRLEDKFICKLQKTKSNICFIAKNIDNALFVLQKLNKDKYFVFVAENKDFVLYKIEYNKIIEKKYIFNLKYLPVISFEINWFFILVTLYLLEFDLKELNFLFSKKINKLFDSLDHQEHRLEHFININGIDFYNDSKSTVFQATIEAVKKISKKLNSSSKNNRSIILILGGLGKGVDRSPLLEFLKKEKKIKDVFCFGVDCDIFFPYKSYTSLIDVIDVTFDVIEPGDTVLFSPSGSSFDLFKNYKDRGNRFKKAVLNRKQNNKIG